MNRLSRDYPELEFVDAGEQRRLLTLAHRRAFPWLRVWAVSVLFLQIALVSARLWLYRVGFAAVALTLAMGTLFTVAFLVSFAIVIKQRFRTRDQLRRELWRLGKPVCMDCGYRLDPVGERCQECGARISLAPP